MNSLRDITLLVFLLGSSAVCSGGQMSYENGEYHHNPRYGGNGLDYILKAVLAHESTGHGQHAESISNSNGNNIQITKQGFGSSQDSGYSQYKPSQHSSNGYQYMTASGDEGLHYPNTGAQNGLQYHNNNNGYQGYEYSSPTATFGNKPKINPGQSSNLGYQYDAPQQNYFESYKPSTNYNNDYQYQKPEHQSSSTYSNFKGHPYLPAPSPSNTGYQYQQQGSSKDGHVSTGYQYESPKQSGYSYDKPQQSVLPSESNFKGQSYLPLPPSSFPAHHNDGHSHGYSYDRSSTSFKGKPYLPLTPTSGGW